MFLSALGFLSYPSTISEGIDTADLLICDVRPYSSFFGNVADILDIIKQSSYGFCLTFNALKFFMCFTRSLDPLESLNPMRSDVSN